MDRIDPDATGWRPMRWPLKVLFVVLCLWIVGSAFNLPTLMRQGLPLLGTFVFGMTAMLVVLALDVLGPLGVLVGLWLRQPWTPAWAALYLGLFVLNGMVALVTLSDVLGVLPILVPTLAGAVFLALILWQRDYFDRG